MPVLVDPAPAAIPGDERGRRLRRLLLGADVAALCSALAVIQLAAGDFPGREAPLLLLSVPLWVLLAYAHRLYHLDSYCADYGAADELGPVLQMATVWSWMTLLALAVTGVAAPLGGVTLLWLLTMIFLTSLRSLARAFARRQAWYLQHALVVGPTSQTAEIIRKIERHPEWRINARAAHDDDNLVQLVGYLGVDRVMLAPEVSESRRRAVLVNELNDLGVHVDLVPSWSDTVGSRLQLHELEGMPLITVPRPALGRSAQRLKRAFDVLVAGAAIVVLSPLLAICAIAIKLDSPGSVLFRQRRVGRNNECFEVFKFRSMCADADARKDEIAELNVHGGGTVTGMFKIREDPRITRVGAFLRRYSLDELPSSSTSCAAR